MGALQPMHLFVVGLVALLVLGPKKLPQLARSIGESMKELKKSLRGVTESEPVAMVKEFGQTVSDLKSDLNPLASPRVPRVGPNPTAPVKAHDAANSPSPGA